jgi:sugar phosphate isomerase/epimerase
MAALSRTRGRLCGIGDEGAADLAGQIEMHRQAQMPALELRTIGGRGLHELTAQEAHAAADAVGEAGLTVPVVDTPVGGWSVDVGVDLASELRLLQVAAERAGRFGCRMLRVMSYPSDGRSEPKWRAEALHRMRELTAVAADANVVLLHENCQGWASVSADHTLQMLAAVDSPNMRLLFDIGNGVAYGYDAVDFLTAVLPWVSHVHVKDGIRPLNGEEPAWTWPGEGDARVADCVQLLERAGYTGWYSIEPHLVHIPHCAVPQGARDLQPAGVRPEAMVPPQADDPHPVRLPGSGDGVGDDRKGWLYRAHAATFRLLLAGVLDQIDGA